MKDDQIAAMKKGTTLNISVQNQFAREVTFQVPLAGFGKVYDGPPDRSGRSGAAAEGLQDQMQKQADEMRKKLEQGGGQPGAPGAARLRRLLPPSPDAGADVQSRKSGPWFGPLFSCAF